MRMNETFTDAREKAGRLSSEYGRVGIAFALLAVSAIFAAVIVSYLAPKKLRVSFLDVGQGDAILIETPSGREMLIDGGPNTNVLQELSKRVGFFDRTLDVMLATHEDADHITGLIPVLDRYRVSHIIQSPVRAETELARDFSKHVDDEGGSVHVARKGDVVDFGDGVIVRVLYPHQSVSPRLETNDASVSVVVTYGEHSFLLTGDLGMKYESQLIGDYLPKGVTVYKAGHHGSDTSSGEQLLTYIKPEYAIVSAGKDNRYGHPDVDVVARLTKYSQEILSTIDRGTISFVSDGRMLEVKTEK